MSNDLSSSNPFRRKGIVPAQAQAEPSPNTHPSSAQPSPAPIRLDTQLHDAPRKISKQVRVQSPPPLSPELDSASTIGEELYTKATDLSAIIPRDDDALVERIPYMAKGPSDSRQNAMPANPFSRTLETMEQTEEAGVAGGTAQAASPGRPAMDVDAFKRLLMTGDSGLGPAPATVPSQSQVAQPALGSGDSSTDTSSLSRQSMFETVQEHHPESPRTSQEIEEPDEYRRTLASGGRSKPPPPSSRHGKLIRVELRDDPTLPLPPTAVLASSLQHTPSLTDLNKPLPPAPRRASHESDTESIFDKEAAGKTPEPPSPSSSIRRKHPPPAPPLSRRHSQMVSDSRLTRSASNRLSPRLEEDSGLNENPRSKSGSGLSRADSTKAPPPPPSRRLGTVRSNSSSHGLPLPDSSSQDPLTSPSVVSLPPPPPPARSASRSISGDRPRSVLSLDLPSPSGVGKRSSILTPPPPPPPRQGRKSSAETQSQDAADPRRPSVEYPRKSMDSMVRRESIEILEETDNATEDKPDILAEMSKLQKEIDEMRIMGQRRVT